MSSDTITCDYNKFTCACKGIRSCLICEPFKRLQQQQQLVDHPVNQQIEKPREEKTSTRSYTFCSICTDKAWLNPDHSTHGSVNCASDEGHKHITISGIHLFHEVITPQEEQEIISHIDTTPWVESQSGRRKQDYGPKVNFKRQKVKMASFIGLPLYTKDILTRFKNQFTVLSNFNPVEVCNLDYSPERGSSIDPHVDDSWLWGERLLTLNYLSSTRLTLTHPVISSTEVVIVLEPRSLLVLAAEARHVWLHAIKRSDVTSRRVATTWRELSGQFAPGGPSFEAVGRQLLHTACTYV